MSYLVDIQWLDGERQQYKCEGNRIDGGFLVLLVCSDPSGAVKPDDAIAFNVSQIMCFTVNAV